MQLPAILIGHARHLHDAPDLLFAVVPADQHAQQLGGIEPVGFAPPPAAVDFDARRIDDQVGNRPPSRGTGAARSRRGPPRSNCGPGHRSARPKRFLALAISRSSAARSCARRYCVAADCRRARSQRRASTHSSPARRPGTRRPRAGACFVKCGLRVAVMVRLLSREPRTPLMGLVPCSGPLTLDYPHSI